jgi:OOP family OmpA-OmpF porin
MWQDGTVVEAVSSSLTEAHLYHLSTTLPLSPKVIRQVLDQLVALVLRSLQDRVARPNGEEALWTLTQQAHEAGVLGQLSTLAIANKRGVSLMQGLLGENYVDITQRIATAAALSADALASLLEVAVAAVLGTLGQRAAEQPLDAAGLSQWLQQQARAIKPGPDRAEASRAGAPATPPKASSEKEPLQRFTVAGAGTWEKVGGGITFTPGPGSLGRKAAKLPAWVWALVLSAAGLSYLGGYLFLGRQTAATVEALQPGPAPAMPVATVGLPYKPPVAGQERAAPAPSMKAPALPAPAAGHYDPATDTYIYNTGQPLVLTLPDGSRQRVGANSTEYRLYHFLADPTELVDPLNPLAGCLNVDRVYFPPGKATLTAESQQQLQNLAAILKAFPQARIKLGGHTDNVGDDRQNQQLSQQRARAAMYALSALGVPKSRLLTESYGAKALVASNAAPVGRALNRRLSLQVISKTGPMPLPADFKEVAPAASLNPVALAKPERESNARAQRQRHTKVGRWLQKLGHRIRRKRPKKVKSQALLLMNRLALRTSLTSGSRY